MEKKLEKVYISYKHDANYKGAIDAIKRGLNANGIIFSIDENDIDYRDNIEEYEKEIGLADKVIMFVTPAYLRSLDCMFEMVQIFRKGNIEERVFPIVDLGEVPRNSNGLQSVKNYWDIEKQQKTDQIKTSMNSSYVLKVLRKINNILIIIDEFWEFIVHVNTCNYKDLVENDAGLLMEKLKATLRNETGAVGEFTPPEGDIPDCVNTITQLGEKSIYVENNYGNININ